MPASRYDHKPPVLVADLTASRYGGAPSPYVRGMPISNGGWSSSTGMLLVHRATSSRLIGRGPGEQWRGQGARPGQCGNIHEIQSGLRQL